MGNLNIAKRLAQAAPRNSQWQRDLWVSYWGLAVPAERQDKVDEDGGCWKQALDVLSGIKDRGLHLSPEDRQWLDILRLRVQTAP